MNTRVVLTITLMSSMCLVGCSTGPSNHRESNTPTPTLAAQDNERSSASELVIDNSDQVDDDLDIRRHYAGVFRLARESTDLFLVQPVGIRGISNEPGVYIIDMAIIGDSERATEIAFDLSRATAAHAGNFLDMLCDRWRPLTSSQRPGVSPRGVNQAPAARHLWQISARRVLIIEPCIFYAEGDPCGLISVRFKPRGERASQFESIDLDQDEVFDLNWHEFEVRNIKFDS